MSDRPRDERWELRAGERGYPDALLDLGSPPEVIYGLGDPEALRGPCLSIVGARRATPYGLAIAEMAARVAAGQGITVVSGGALGCDHAAGSAALRAGGLEMSWEDFDKAFTLASLDAVRQAVQAGILAALPTGGEADAQKNEQPH